MKSSSHSNTQRRPLATAIAALAAAGCLASSVQAQEGASRSTSAMLEEVVVTARKRTESMQDVPLSVTAFGADQLEALKIRDLTNLAVGMPNVALDDVATSRGYANFSIRGLGINSSILSIDPTVGVFIDQVYLGIAGGIIFDMFDLESIEVLRGPQGILFGRNVTGGAVLINTRKPGDEFEASVRAAVDGGDDGGLNKYLMGSVGGPLTDNLGARLTAYYNEDDGWFENLYNGDDFGEVEQKMLRPVVVWRPSDTTELIMRWEHTEIEGQGPAAQNHVNGSGVPGVVASFKRDSFDFSIDEEGDQEIDTDFVTVEFNWDVGFGDGTVTNIFGWRDYESTTLGDIDAQPFFIFHALSWTEAEQYSNELRYNGTFDDRANVTAGIYYFTNEIDYHERRLIPSATTVGGQFDGGGYYDVETWAAFGAVDYDLSDKLTLTAGIRYTYEEKEADIASLSQQLGVPCNLVDPDTSKGETTCAIDFSDDDSWSTWSPKLGLTYHLTDDSRIYGHWTRGYRSGGYNLRNTSLDPADVPGPFDEEQVDNFEIGYKSEFGRGRLNAALFYNDITDLQRELNKGGPIGVIQLVRNTADAEILGVEIDGTFGLTDNLLLMASLGWIDADYTEVKFDLNGDGVVDGKDEDLELPRAAEWTYSVGLTHDLELGNWGFMSSRINYAYRDDSYYLDSNLGWILDQEILDAGIDFHSNDGHWVFGIYGRNLLDDVKHGGDTNFAPNIGGTFSPLAKGRLYGLEVTYNF